MPNGFMLACARNRIDDATVTASSAATPATRVKNLRPTRRWYATGKVEEYLDFDFGAVVPISHLGFVGFVGDTALQGQAVLSNDAGVIADTGNFTFWEPVYGFGEDPFGESLGGYPVLSEWYAWRANRIVDLGANYGARYLRVYFRNPNNEEIAQVGCGWVYAGQPFSPSWNFEWNFVEGWSDPSAVAESESSVFVRTRKTRQNVRIAISGLTETEALTHFRTINRSVGRAKPILLSLFPDAAAPKRSAFQVYGLRGDDPDLTGVYVDDYAGSLFIKEIPQ